MRPFSVVAVLFCFWLSPPANSAQAFTQICPEGGIQPRGANFEPGGIILTTFDRTAIWVYHISRNARYPLPGTAPCASNCHLSRDAQWITYLNAQDRSFGKMRLDGTQRTPLVSYATEVSWWSDDTLLIWTPSQKAYLRREDGTGEQPLNFSGLVNIQPGGHWGVFIERQDDEFLRVFSNLAADSGEARVILSEEMPYFNASAWSPNGSSLAFIAPVRYDGGLSTELFLIRPGETQPAPLTNLYDTYGSVRINGHDPGELSWSPDGTRIAFWVIPLNSVDPTTTEGVASLHILNVQSGGISVYCGFTTVEHTPNPPRLIWSPDGTHLAFGGNIPEDDKGYLLLALDTASGVFTELSTGIYPALGSPDVIAWGLAP